MASRSISQKLLGKTASGAAHNIRRRCIDTSTALGRSTTTTTTITTTTISSYRTFSTTYCFQAKAAKAKAVKKATTSKPTSEPAVPQDAKPVGSASAASPVADSSTLDVTGVDQHINAPASAATAAKQDSTPFSQPAARSDPASYSRAPAAAPTSLLKAGQYAAPAVAVSSEPSIREQATPLRRKMADALDAVIPRSVSETYVAYGYSENLFKECKKQAEYFDGVEHTDNAKFWYKECGLPVQLYTWAQITTLHMWCIMVRLRYIDPTPADRYQTWQQHFVNHMFYDLEDMMANRYNIKSSSARNRHLKQFNEQFRGSIAAYDEGLVRGDATLAAALWRNIWDANAEVDFQKLAMMVGYVRRIISGLENVGDEVLLEARLYFGNPADEEGIVVKLAEEGRKNLEAWRPPAKPVEEATAEA